MSAARKHGFLFLAPERFVCGGFRQHPFLIQFLWDCVLGTNYLELREPNLDSCSLQQQCKIRKVCRSRQTTRNRQRGSDV